MNSKIIIISIGIILIVFLVFSFTDNKNDNSTDKNKATTVELFAPLNSQINDDGAVTVEVALSNQIDWSFEITLSTHSVDIIEDLTKVSVLVDENGNEYKPIKWQGDSPGGHHRKGVLKFNPIAPIPKLMILKIQQIGGVDERVFTWSASI